MLVWDLAESEGGPAIVTASPARDAQKGRIVDFAVSSAMHVAATSASQVNLAAGAGRNATMVLAYEKGAVEVHLLEHHLVEMGIDEESVFEGILGLEREGERRQERGDGSDDGQ